MGLKAMLKRLGVPVLLLLVALPVRGGVVAEKVDGNAYEARVRLPGGIAADLAVTFEDVVGLTPDHLGVSADLLSTAGLAALQGRLPGNLVSVPSGFPVLVTIEPPAEGGLSFSGVVAVELYTHDLAYAPGNPLRLFAAPLGGPFVDITASAGAGSYRVRGHKGKFSELVIAADLRPVDSVIDLKLARVQAILDDNAAALDPQLLADLQALLDAVETAWLAGDTTAAIAAVEAFADAVEAASGAGVPDVWRSARDLVNVAGELRAAASTLRYSLLVKSNA